MCGGLQEDGCASAGLDCRGHLSPSQGRGPAGLELFPTYFELAVLIIPAASADIELAVLSVRAASADICCHRRCGWKRC